MHHSALISQVTHKDMWKISTKTQQNPTEHKSVNNSWDVQQHWQGNDPFAIHYMEVIKYISKWYGSGQEGAAVLLPGFAIIW